jgi:hypothetical protein
MGTSKYAFESRNIEELQEAVKKNKVGNNRQYFQMLC